MENKEIENLINNLIDYILDNQNENDDFQRFCADNDLSNEIITEKHARHIYGVALVLSKALQERQFFIKV